MKKCESYSHFFIKNISIYAICNDRSFNGMLTNDIVSFEQLGPGNQGYQGGNISTHVCFTHVCLHFLMKATSHLWPS